MKIDKHIETLMKVGIISNLIVFLASIIFKFDSLSLILVTLINAFIYFILVVSKRFSHLFEAVSQGNKLLKSLNNFGGF